jgi:hypothetical protein
MPEQKQTLTVQAYHPAALANMILRARKKRGKTGEK